MLAGANEVPMTKDGNFTGAAKLATASRDAVAMYTNAEGFADVSRTLTFQLDHLRGDVAVVHASGCLDQTTAPDLQHVLDDLLEAVPWAIVIDLSALSVLNPGAVASLVDVAYRAGEANIGICLVSADLTINGVLASEGVAELFEIQPATDAALRVLS